MNKKLTLVAGAGIGAGLMYFLDPDRGKRRRIRVRDQMEHIANKTGRAAGTTSRDVKNRITGLVSDLKNLVTRESVDEEVLVARVRAKLGRAVSHPGSIEVKAEGGRIILSGPVLADEIERLIESVASVRGVESVDNRLQSHSWEDIPALQGGRTRDGEVMPVMQANWSPTTRLAAGIGGCTLMYFGSKSRGIVGIAAGITGAGLVSRAATNLTFKRLIGADDRRAIDLQKTINIAAPLEKVFEFWTHHENFPKFMRNVREVKDLGNGRYHWTVAGPAGLSVGWDAEISKLVPNQILAWKSLPGQTVAQAGIIHFQSNSDGTTRVDIKLSYSPPAGAVGHLIARLFGVDPKSEMDQDLMRMKSFIETGHVPHDAAQKPAGKAAAQHAGE